eukprot:8506509-Pyramimonas_sp.AAC.1
MLLHELPRLAWVTAAPRKLLVIARGLLRLHAPEVLVVGAVDRGLTAAHRFEVPGPRIGRNLQLPPRTGLGD